MHKPALFLLSLPVAAGLTAAESNPPSDPVSAVQPAVALTPGSILAAQIRDIVATKDLSRRSQNRQIATAIRLAITTATAKIKNFDEALKLVEEITAQAAQAAPEFAEVITAAVSEAVQQVPVLAAAQADLKVEIQNAVFAGVKAAATGSGIVHFEENPEEPSRPVPPAPEYGGKTDTVIVSPSH